MTDRLLHSWALSYTEKEYDYAVAQGLKVIALLHGAPDSLPVSKSELAPDKVARLAAFREKVGTGRLVKFWQGANELPGLVALSLSKTIKTYPATGWVRADAVANVELLAELNAARKRNDELTAEIRSIETQLTPASPNLADLGDTFDVSGRYSKWNGHQSTYHDWSGRVTWESAFGLLAPHLLHPMNDATAASTLAQALFKHLAKSGSSPTLDDQAFQTIKVQLLAHGLVSLKSYPTTKGSTALFWELTPKGRAQMLAIRTIKRTAGPGQAGA